MKLIPDPWTAVPDDPARSEHAPPGLSSKRQQSPEIAAFSGRYDAALRRLGRCADARVVVFGADQE
jgi:hypothetical protein